MKSMVVTAMLALLSIGLSGSTNEEIEQDRLEAFAERKGRLRIFPIHTSKTPEGSSSAYGKAGTWDYDAGYLYIWITDEVCMRVALEYFGGARIRTVEDNLPIKTVNGEWLRTVGTYSG